jgi:hypothetical protein
MPRRSSDEPAQTQLVPRESGAFLIERHGGSGTVTVTPKGIAHVKARAAEGVSQQLIAAELGITKFTLRQVFERQEAVRIRLSAARHCSNTSLFDR